MGICFDIEKVGPGKYGMKCWEIFWRAVEPRMIAGSSLFEGSVLDSDNVYCLAIQGHDAMPLMYVTKALETNTDFLDTCDSRRFFVSEDVLRQPLVAAGQIDVGGNLIGISYNARMALNQVKREKAAAMQARMAYDTRSGNAAGNDAAAQGSAPAQLKKWWRVWRS